MGGQTGCWWPIAASLQSPAGAAGPSQLAHPKTGWSQRVTGQQELCPWGQMEVYMPDWINIQMTWYRIALSFNGLFLSFHAVSCEFRLQLCAQYLHSISTCPHAMLADIVLLHRHTYRGTSSTSPVGRSEGDISYGCLGV